MTVRRIVLSVVLLVISGVGFGLMLATPPTSSVSITCVQVDDACVRLPTITGTNLNGETQTFPTGFRQPYQLVVMPFDREQQSRVLDFVPLFQELAAARPDVGYYSLAALPNLAAPIRLLVSGGMTAVVTDDAVRNAAYIFYLEDQAAFLQALALPDAETLRVFLFNQAGDVLWQASGDYSNVLEESIRGAVGGLATSDS